MRNPEWQPRVSSHECISTLLGLILMRSSHQLLKASLASQGKPPHPNLVASSAREHHSKTRPQLWRTLLCSSITQITSKRKRDTTQWAVFAQTSKTRIKTVSPMPAPCNWILKTICVSILKHQLMKMPL